ncbi:MAG TPA: hypothetical protein VH207_07715 [Chthoniobacterales bacterium]|jgi:hypothetical protein|nr:hypothetical protein [Chthoniobacterales bacterium]
MNRDIRKDLTDYYKSHPHSPAARQHPRILIDHGRYVALLGRSINRGIVGFGSSVASALHAFDDLYRKAHPTARH